MALTIRTTSGTYMGDPNNIFIDEETTIDGSTNKISISGTLSYYGQIFPLSGTFTMPAPNASEQYVSLQVDSTGNLHLYNDNSGNCMMLQPGNIFCTYCQSIPPNAANDQSFDWNDQPSLG